MPSHNRRLAALRADAGGLMGDAGAADTRPSVVLLRLFYVVGGAGIGGKGLACIDALQVDPTFACSVMPVSALEGGAAVAVQLWFQSS